MDLDKIKEAQQRIDRHVLRTPCERSDTLSAILGLDLWIKFENQQFTASFKERGALNCLLSLPQEMLARGVIAMSAGNHAQAVAYHGGRLGVPTTIVMPRTTPNAKVAQTRVHGAEVILHGEQFDETRAFTRNLAAERDLTIVHPYDDEAVIAGQGTIGVEIVEQAGQPDAVVVPVGGGGLASGVATAVKSLSPQTQVIGVQVARYDNAARAFFDQPPGSTGLGTVAEGIAVKQPGQRTMPLLKALLDDIVVVEEDEVEQAIFDLLEIEKTVAEGAGAATLAAIGRIRERLAGKRVVAILSGGNIDMMVLSSVLRRGLVRSHRLVRLEVEIPDLPGALAQLTAQISAFESNIVDIVHNRAFGPSSVRATMVELTLEMRGEEQTDTVISGLKQQGYDVRLVNVPLP